MGQAGKCTIRRLGVYSIGLGESGVLTTGQESRMYGRLAVKEMRVRDRHSTSVFFRMVLRVSSRT